MSYEFQMFFLTFGVVRSDFFCEIFKPVAQGFAMLIPLVEHFCPLVTRTCGGFLHNLTVEKKLHIQQFAAATERHS